jgi:hypothetical protein
MHGYIKLVLLLDALMSKSYLCIDWVAHLVNQPHLGVELATLATCWARSRCCPQHSSDKEITVQLKLYPTIYLTTILTS